MHLIIEAILTLAIIILITFFAMVFGFISCFDSSSPICHKYTIMLVTFMIAVPLWLWITHPRSIQAYMTTGASIIGGIAMLIDRNIITGPAFLNPK